MSKILGGILLFFLFLNQAWANEEIKIITRAEWWANESYRYLDSPEWKTILEKWDKTPKKELTEVQKKEALKRAEKTKIANDFLVSEFRDIFTISSIIKYENNRKLAWPIAKSKKKNSIVIHHTDNDYSDSIDAMNKIYKYHAIQKQWWDIWYNYLIWINWEIFEWRAGWDYVVWAHDKWNNQWSIGIALIWNYDKKAISNTQYDSLEKLVIHLWKKYDINLNKKVPFFKWCSLWEQCDKKPLDISYHYPIIWHRDAWHTNCPWDELYKQMQKLKKALIKGPSEINNLSIEKIKRILLDVKEDTLIRFLAIIEDKLDKTKNQKNLEVLTNLKELILNIESERNNKILDLESFSGTLENDIPNKKKQDENLNNKKSFDDNNRIRVRLSYPHENDIDISARWIYTPKLNKDWKEYILHFDDCNWENCENKEKNYKIHFSFSGSKLFFNEKEVKGFDKERFFRVKSPKDLFLTITSWNRVPSWDTQKKYNDNKFRWDIVLYQKDDELIVVNELFLTDYLKWLWEVSESTNTEKIRTIIILARTYARWYMTKAEKFVDEWYHASDDPNVFQRYIGFWLEERSPKINKIVEETKDLIVTYDGELIKPWYFSSSDWKTKDFIEFCKTAKWVPDCSHPERFPFLIWVKDPWGEWKERWGHWIWVPWTGVKYLSERWWKFSMIIKYFLKGVEINKI
jgi:hypothetical protein